VAGRIRSTDKSNELIGNRNRDLPAGSIVPKPTTLKCSQHTPSMESLSIRNTELPANYTKKFK
jgi:hypothetical protein